MSVGAISRPCAAPHAIEITKRAMDFAPDIMERWDSTIGASNSVTSAKIMIQTGGGNFLNLFPACQKNDFRDRVTSFIASLQPTPSVSFRINWLVFGRNSSNEFFVWCGRNQVDANFTVGSSITLRKDIAADDAEQEFAGVIEAKSMPFSGPHFDRATSQFVESLAYS